METGEEGSKNVAILSQSKLQDFFVIQLKDIYWAEKKLVKTLPKMKDAATFEKLKKAFHDHLDQTVVFLDDAQDLEAADARQADIEEYEIDVLLVENGERGFAAGDAQDSVIALENRGEGIPHSLVVVDDENGLRFLTHRAGSARPRVLWQAVDTVASRSLRYEFC